MIRCDYLIVGAGAGGTGACEGIREHDSKGSIVMVGAEAVLPYDRAKLFQTLLGKTKKGIEEIQFHDSAWFEKNGVRVRLSSIVTQFNIERHQAVLDSGLAIEFRKGCIATGSRARRPQLAGAHIGNVFYPRTYRDVSALREVLEGETEVVIVGGGLLGAEIASILAQRSGLDITLVHRGNSLFGKRLDDETTKWLEAQFVAHDVRLMMRETVNGFEGRTVLENVQTKSGARLQAGVAIVTVGADFNLGLFQNTPLSYPGGCPVNQLLETDEKTIYAVGDVSLFPDVVFGGQRRVDDAFCAITQGRHAGANMTGKRRSKWEWVPWQQMTFFDLHFDLLGDFSKPPTRVEFEGDHAKKKFVARYFQGNALVAMVVCNQPEKASACRDTLKSWKREIKRMDL